MQPGKSCTLKLKDFSLNDRNKVLIQGVITARAYIMTLQMWERQWGSLQNDETAKSRNIIDLIFKTKFYPTETLHGKYCINSQKTKT